jgi:hypothetical protein
MQGPFPLRPRRAWLLAVVLLGVAAAGPARAQISGQVCGAVPVPEVILKQPDASSTGWLIVRGVLVEGPYTAVVGDDTVVVNGVPLAAPRAPLPSDPDPGARAQLFEQFWLQWRQWCDTADLEIARTWAVDWWNSAPGVMLAERVPPDDGDLRLWFDGDPDYQLLYLQPPASDLPPPDEASRLAVLEELRQEVQATLDHGRLLVVEDEGYSLSFPSGESGEVMAQIEAIGATLADEEARFQALRVILPDEQTARSIAKNFGPFAEVAHDRL